MATVYSHICSCLTWLICGVITIALGLCRFACVLLLPNAHGLLYAVNVTGFFVGAMGASAIVRRIAALNTVGIAVGVCVLSLATSTLTTQLMVVGVELTRLGVGR